MCICISFSGGCSYTISASRIGFMVVIQQVEEIKCKQKKIKIPENFGRLKGRSREK
jgi:hypothetical protein